MQAIAQRTISDRPAKQLFWHRLPFDQSVSLGVIVRNGGCQIRSKDRRVVMVTKPFKSN